MTSRLLKYAKESAIEAIIFLIIKIVLLSILSFNKLLELEIFKFGMKGILFVLISAYLIWFVLLFLVNFIKGELQIIKNKVK